jgi:hypothetical protein
VWCAWKYKVMGLGTEPSANVTDLNAHPSGFPVGPAWSEVRNAFKFYFLQNLATPNRTRTVFNLGL